MFGCDDFGEDEKKKKKKKKIGEKMVERSVWLEREWGREN